MPPQVADAVFVAESQLTFAPKDSHKLLKGTIVLPFAIYESATQSGLDKLPLILMLNAAEAETEEARTHTAAAKDNVFFIS